MLLPPPEKGKVSIMIKYVTGNILDSEADAILHQVNCQGTMGAGLAKQIKDCYPHVYEKYRTACTKDKFECRALGLDKSRLLGKIQIIPKQHHSENESNIASQVIVNLFAQEFFGRDRRYTDYDALRSCLRKVNERFAGQTVAIPYFMGCGLAGGSWDIVLEIIVREFQDCNVLIYKYFQKQND